MAARRNEQPGSKIASGSGSCSCARCAAEVTQTRGSRQQGGAAPLAAALRHQRQIDRPVGEAPQQLDRRLADDVDMDAGMALREAGQDARQEGAGIVVGRADGHLAGQRVAVERGQRLDMGVQDVPGMGQQGLAVAGQPDRAPGAREQLAAEQLLQPLDLHADRRLGAVDPVRRGGEAAGLRDRDEAAQQLGLQGGEHGLIHQRR